MQAVGDIGRANLRAWGKKPEGL